MEKYPLTPKILPLKNDYVFKLVFGDQRRVALLTSFLQAVLDLPEEEYEKVTIIDPNVKKEYHDDKAGVLDVKIETKTGNIIDVEIQVLPVVPLRQRVSFYQAKMLLEQIDEGDDYNVIKKVISIIITDFVMIPDSEPYHHRFVFYDPENGVMFSDMQEIHVLEMPKLPAESDATELFDWLSLIGAKQEEDYDMLAQKKPEFEKVVAIVKQFSAEEQARAEYEQHKKWRMDYVSSMNMATRTGMEKGLEKGLTEGKAEGRAEGEAKSKMSIAKNMLSEGMSVALIAKMTGLSAAEIEHLQ